MENKKIIHIALILVLLIGTLFAWYQSARDYGMFGCESQVCSVGAETMVGIPICVWGALFFTIALVLAIVLWYQK